MKKPAASASAETKAKYKAFLAKKAERNKAARAKKSAKVVELKQIAARVNDTMPMTREEWLMRAIVALKPIFAERGYTIPENVKATIGFPCVGARGKRVGECHCETASSGGVFELFISPRLDDTDRVLDILVHELGHVCVGVRHGHRKPFAKFCEALALEGKPTVTIGGEAFKKIVAPVVAELGKLPHKALTLGGGKKQTTRMLLVECPCCSFKFRAARKPLLAAVATDDKGAYLHCVSPACVQDNPNYPANGASLKMPTRIYLDPDSE